MVTATPGLDVVVRPPSGLAGRLLVAVSEDRLSSKVERGENRGLTLAHAPVARLLVDEGPVGTEHHVRLGLSPGWKREQLRVVAFVQDPGGRVVAVGTAPVPPDGAEPPRSTPARVIPGQAGLGTCRFAGRGKAVPLRRLDLDPGGGGERCSYARSCWCARPLWWAAAM